MTGQPKEVAKGLMMGCMDSSVTTGQCSFSSRANPPKPLAFGLSLLWKIVIVSKIITKRLSVKRHKPRTREKMFPFSIL